jgi:PPOX class probable F420-dependent enzyme
VPRMDPDEARRRFWTARVARLATVDTAGRPHQVPVVFAALGDNGVVTAVDRKPKTTTRLARLRNIGANPSVSLLADHYTEDWDRLWWVRADGRARIVPPDTADESAAGEYGTALARLLRKYPQYRDAPPHGPVIAVAVHRWTGWRAAPFGTAGSGYAADSRSVRSPRSPAEPVREVPMTRRVRDVMSPGAVAVEPMTTLERAARVMREQNVGDVLVVYDCDLFGLLTDRDIVIRAVAEGRDPHTTAAGSVCTRPPVVTLDPEDTTDHAVELMRKHAVRRLPVVERGGCPVGMVSLGDLATSEDPHSALSDISRADPNH